MKGRANGEQTERRRGSITPLFLISDRLGISSAPSGRGRMACFWIMTREPSPPCSALPLSRCGENRSSRLRSRTLSLGATSASLSWSRPSTNGLTGSTGPWNRLAPSATYIEQAVEIGLPRVALRHLVELLVGDDKSKISTLEWDVVPKTTLKLRKSKLSPQESERTERIARLFVRSRRALGTEAEAREFLTSPHPELDGKTPFDAARTDLGATSPRSTKPSPASSARTAASMSSSTMRASASRAPPSMSPRPTGTR